MKPATLLLIFCACILRLSAQENTGDKTHRNFKVTPSSDAHYPGGQEALSDWIYMKMKYPAEALKQRKEAEVAVSFDVNPDSTTSNITALSDPGLGFREEAERLISITKFAPAIQNGRPIRQMMILTIPFHLSKNE